MRKKLKAFRLSIKNVSKLEDLAKSPQYSSEAFIVDKALEQFFDSLVKKPEEKPPVEDLRPQLTEALKEVERLKDVLRKETECFSRFEHEGKSYCAKNAPKITELLTIKICRACRFKITKETLAKELPQIHYYYTCGATEKLDAKTGTTWLFSKNPACPPELKGKWLTMQQCNAVGCQLLKTYYVRRK